MQVLEDQNERLDLALTEEETLHGREGLPAAIRGIELTPRGVIDRDVEQRQNGRKGRFQGTVERQEFARDLLANIPLVVAVLDSDLK